MANFVENGRVMVREQIKDAVYPLVAGDMGTVISVEANTVVVLFDKYPGQSRKMQKRLLIA